MRSFNPHLIQVLGISGSILFLAFILLLIRSRQLKEQYALLWLFFGAVFLGFSVWRRGLEVLARLLGIDYAPAAMFLVMILGIVVILIHYSLIISRTTEDVKNLAQEVGLLRLEVTESKGGTGAGASPPEPEEGP